MKIVCISDTHGKAFHDQIPDCDVLLHCGDICPVFDHSLSFQKQWVRDTFIPDLEKIPAKHIVFIGGNHDFYLYKLYEENRENEIKYNLPGKVHYLRDTSVTIDGLKIHGTPWVNNLPMWAFNSPTDKFANERFKSISKSVDILMTHGPAFGYCDTIKEHNETERLGHPILLEHIIRASPQIVVCGHIHSGNHERELLYLGNEKRKTSFFNVSLLNEQYKFAYKPRTLNYNKGEITWI